MSELRSNAVSTSKAEKRRLSSRTDDASWYSSAISGDAGGIGAYSEEAFRYLLALERKRAERYGRSFLLLLVDLKKASHRLPSMDAEIAAIVFDGLSSALRDTDFIGWYRDGRIAGAVLVQLSGAPSGEMADAVGQRVRNDLLSRVPADVASRLQTRVFQIPRTFRS
jgi:hypothetical protein